MDEGYKCQVSFTVNGIMVNVRGETDQEVATRANAWIDRIKAMKKLMEGAKEGGKVVSMIDAYADQMVCPKCGGELWDNRGSEKNKENPKLPAFKCKDGNCGKAAWIRNGKLSWSK